MMKEKDEALRQGSHALSCEGQVPQPLGRDHCGMRVIPKITRMGLGTERE